MEIIRALASLAEPPGRETAALAELLELGEPPADSDYSDLFVFQLYPYASVYLGAEGMMGGEARDRVAGFWRALDLSPPPEPDHLALLLALYARLAELESEAGGGPGRQAWGRAREALLREHLLSWLPPYLARLEEIAPPFYRGWGRLLTKALAAEAGRADPPERLPLHLREAPPLADPRREGGEAFLGSLLSPVRCGLLLLRADLERACRQLGLALRAGERRFALRALLGQDSAAILGWLAREAAGWSGRHRAYADLDPQVSAFWSERARFTQELLLELAS